MYADSMGFVGLPDHGPLFLHWGRPKLSLIHARSVPPFVTDYERVLEIHQKFVATALSNEGVRHVRKGNDIPDPDSETIGFMFGLQNPPRNLTRERTRMLKEAGVQFMALAYRQETPYGGGFVSGGALTPVGRELLEWMAQEKIILDLSGASHETMHDALAFIEEEGLPIQPIASHSACFDLHPHPRNLPRNLLRKIAKLGGYVGIPAVSFFLGPPRSNHLELFLWHVLSAVRSTTPQTIGIGSGCLHMDRSVESARKHFKRRRSTPMPDGRFREYFPEYPLNLVKHGSRMFDFFFEQFESLDEQYPKGRVVGVCGENFKKYLQRAL